MLTLNKSIGWTGVCQTCARGWDRLERGGVRGSERGLSQSGTAVGGTGASHASPASPVGGAARGLQRAVALIFHAMVRSPIFAGVMAVAPVEGSPDLQLRDRVVQTALPAVATLL
jgi:hypothetical protein